jgi:L-asparaginase II
LPLAALARAFCQLANPSGLPDVRQSACLRLRAAVHAEPVLLAGPGRLCTALLQATPGPRLLPKNGAEGVYAVGAARHGAQPGFGLAIKVEDGAERGYVPVVVELLRELGVWDEVPAELRDFHAIPLRNTQSVEVGHVRSALGRLVPATARRP